MKIDIRELRAKNYIRSEAYEAEMLVVQEIDGYTEIVKVEDMDNSTSLTFDVAHPDPIPFTTEWAERFKLLNQVINGFCIHPSEYAGHDYDLCLYDEHTWESERRVLCPINSVHHCQNLFLDLANYILE